MDPKNSVVKIFTLSLTLVCKQALVQSNPLNVPRISYLLASFLVPNKPLANTTQ